MFSMLRAAKKL